MLCVLSVPFVYNYVQHVQSVIQNEADFCKVIISDHSNLPTYIVQTIRENQ